MIDFGLPPSVIEHRLSRIGRNWSSLSAVILTHTHGDHWNLPTLKHLRTLDVPLYLHVQHADFLSRHQAMEPMQRAGLIRTYADSTWLSITSQFSVLPVKVPHDAEPTFAFRFEFHADHDRSWAVGHASDLGCMPAAALAAFHDVDVLALEFNHDALLQQNSGRHPILIRRVLGDRGHLSNSQAAQVLKTITAGSRRRLRHLVQLHLSHECNTEALARAACLPYSFQTGGTYLIHTAYQDAASSSIELELDSPAVRYAPQTELKQGILPGMMDNH